MSMSNDIASSIALSNLGWEPLEMMRKGAKARLMYKTLHKMGPESLTKLFIKKSEVTNHKLRGISSGLCVPQPRTNNMKNSLFDGAQLWNSIPNEIRECKTFACFQNGIATHIFQ